MNATKLHGFSLYVTLCLVLFATSSAVAQAVIPGDFDGNAHIDLVDFVILKVNFGRWPVAHHEGDTDLNGKVDLTDFGILKDNFGKSGAPAVPEPSTWLLAALAAGGCAVIRSRWRPYQYR